MKKKNIPIYILLSTLSHIYNPAQAQNIQATYSLEQNKSYSMGPGGEKGNIILYYIGQIYQSDNKTACYMFQNFDKEIIGKRTGDIIELGQTTDGINIITNAPTDTLIYAAIFRQDSLTLNRWIGFNMIANNQWHYSYFSFTKAAGYAQPTGDTAIKNGMRCIRILFYGAGDKKLDFDGWVCPDVKLTYGFHNLRNFPGLIVEGYDYGMKFKYKLIDLKIGQPIDPSVFWPAKFANANFTKPQDIDKATVEKNKKKADIMVQN